MKHDDENALLLCPIPLHLLQEIDALATEQGRDRGKVIVALLREALGVHAIGRAVEQSMQRSAVIRFPRPTWAVDDEGFSDA